MNDAAAALLAHDRKHGLACKERRRQVYRDYSLKVRVGEVAEQLARPDSRVVDEHIYAPELCEALFDHFFRFTALREVENSVARSRRALLHSLVGRFTYLGWVAIRGQENVQATLSEGKGNRLANPSRCSRDKGDTRAGAVRHLLRHLAGLLICVFSRGMNVTGRRQSLMTVAASTDHRTRTRSPGAAMRRVPTLLASATSRSLSLIHI